MLICKSHLHARLAEIAQAEGWKVMADGVHADDLHDHVHGMAVARAWCSFALAGNRHRKTRGARLWRISDCPYGISRRAPCLALRVPHGTAVTAEVLAQIEAAEDVLERLGFRQYRVRHHGQIARIELPPADLQRAVELREPLTAGLRQAGYRFITLDLEGFRSGSLSETELSIPVSVTARRNDLTGTQR